MDFQTIQRTRDESKQFLGRLTSLMALNPELPVVYAVNGRAGAGADWIEGAFAGCVPVVAVETVAYGYRGHILCKDCEPDRWDPDNLEWFPAIVVHVN